MGELVETLNDESARLPGFEKEIVLELGMGRLPSVRAGSRPVSALRQNLASVLPFAVRRARVRC